MMLASWAPRFRLRILILILYFWASVLAAQIIPTAVFLDASGATRSFSFGFPDITNAGGVLADRVNPFDEPASATVTAVASAQNPQGDVYVAGVDPSGGVSINVLHSATQSWSGWIAPIGASFVSNTADIAIGPDGTAWIVALDITSTVFTNGNSVTAGNVWLNSYTPNGGFSGWTLLTQGSTDQLGLGNHYRSPIVRVTPDGSIYIAMQNIIGILELPEVSAISVGKYTPGSGFTFLQHTCLCGGALRGPIATIGSDGALYLFILRQQLPVHPTLPLMTMSRISGTTWEAEYSPSTSLNDVARLAAGAGRIFVVALDSLHNVWKNEFIVGSGDGWQSWTNTNGSLETISAASVGDRLYIAGFDRNDDLWWYEAGGAGWTNYGNRGIATSFMTATPK